MKFLQRNLMARLMTYFVLLAMLSLMIGFTGYEVARRSIVGQVEAHLDSVASLKEVEIESWVKHLGEYLDWMATTPRIQSHVSTLVIQATTPPKHLTAHESLVAEFRRAVALGEMSLVFLLDSASGQVVASSNPTWEGIFRGNERYFVEGKNRTYMSGIFYSLKLDRATMVISTPVKDSAGQLLAVLVAHASMERLAGIMLERTGLGETGETYLVNKNNLMLTESRFLPEAALEHWVFTEGVDRALKGGHGTSFYPDYRGVLVIGGYRWLENMEVALLSEIDQAEAVAPIKDLRNIFIGTASGVIVIITLLYLLLSRSVSQPIKRLVSATRMVAQGNLDYRVGAIASDEIGELAGAFDQMTARLKEITASRDDLDKEIVERKVAEKALKKSEAGLAKAQQIAHLGNFDWNVKDNTSHLSIEYYRIFGLSPQQSGFDYDEFISYVHPDDREFVKRNTGESLYQKAPHSIDYRIILPDGSERTVHAEAEVTFDEAGEPMRMIGIIQDITERKKMEEQMRQSQLLASLGEMTAGIAHEVNNPLSSILLYSELLTADDVPKHTRKDLRVIHNEAKRAAKIMTDLLTYGRKVTPRVRRVDLHKILRNISSMRQYRQKVQNIKQSSNLLKGPLYINGDANQLMQVFMNLIVNAEEALKESGGGNIVVTTQKKEEWVKVSITDNGTGIPEENLSRVFHPFYTTRDIGEGTGLGLSMSYGIITAHKGLIRAENNETGGATFTVELPVYSK